MRLKLLAILLLLSLAGFGQSQVKGKVTDESGQAIPGASVLLKGTSAGTVTDTEGVYTLQGIPADGTLVFSFIGYTTQEVAVGGREIIDIGLNPDSKTLEEVVVIGYGTSTVKELTGAVSSVNAKDIARINPVRVDQAMQGQMAGVNISTNSASPGGAMNIRIRGITTTQSNSPYILVDGIPYSFDGLNALNPADIESIDVLKDASAAIYGVLGANGVIFITTKKGKKNTRPVVDFSGYVGVQETAKKLRLLDAREFAVLKNEAYAAGGQTPPYANTDLGTGTDWQREIFQSAPMQNYNLNITGGSDKNTYSIGGSYTNQLGIVGGDKASYRRYNARATFVTDISSKVKLESMLLYTNERRKTVPERGIASVLYNTINASPLASPRTPQGTYTYLEEFSDIINPLAQIDNTFNQANVNKIVGKEELTYKISNSFEITGRAGYGYAIVDDKTFSPLVYYGSGKAQNTASNAALVPFTTEIAPDVEIPVQNNVKETRSTYFNYNLEAFLTYNKTIGSEHKINAVFGTSLLSNINNQLSGTAYNVPYNAWEFADISLADPNNLLNNTTSSQTKGRMLSFFARGRYSYRERYLVQLIARRDGSTAFGKNNRIGYFPSVLAGWVVSEESFFQSNLIQFLKIRGGYGTTGNDQIGYYRYRALLGGEAVYPFDDQLTNGVAAGVLGNPDLKWETTVNFNIGADVNLFQDRLSLSADYYIKTTKDLLFQPQISGVLGAGGAGGQAPFVNAGSVRNKGFEFIVAYNQTLRNDLRFNVKYNLTTIKNEVISMPVDFLEGGAFGVGGGNATRMQVGLPMGYFYGYKTDGVYQTADEVTERGVTQDGARAGDLRYADLSGDGVVNFSDNSDKTIIGSPIPSVTMGLVVGVDFKGFDISALLYSSIGNEIIRNYERQQPLANQLDYKINRWTGPGSTNENPRLTTGTNRNNVFSDYFVEDGSYLRIKNVQLGYTVPSAITQRIGATRVRVYVAANNLVTWTKYRGFDPDTSTGEPLGSGIDIGTYPQAKIYMAGLNLTF
jgi:TonB-dependent starch-binding outer membrane protein SusC